MFAEHVNQEILLLFPHTHQVFTIPKRLRPFYKFNRKLIGDLFNASKEAWGDYLTEALPGCKPASISALHSFGDLLQWHPHIHSLTLMGGIESNTGKFRELESVNTAQLEKLFADKVFQSLLEKELLSLEDIESMQAWEHFHLR